MSTAKKTSAAPETVTMGALPASRKIFVEGVAMREIALSNGAKQVVYDTSGPYTDVNAKIDISKGLPKMRAAWIEGRGDVEKYIGRDVRPEDNGLPPLSSPPQAGGAEGGRQAPVAQFPNVNKTPYRAKDGKAVTQLSYARAGIAEYWIINIEAQRLEVYREPAGEEYLQRATLGRDGVVTIAGMITQVVRKQTKNGAFCDGTHSKL